MSKQEQEVVEFASEQQKQLFLRGPLPTLASGGFNAGKTRGAILKALYLMDTYHGYRVAIIRRRHTELEKTTLPTLFKMIPAHLIAAKNDQKGELILKNGSRFDFLHLEKPDVSTVLRGLEINGFILDQAEEMLEDTFDVLETRVNRWDQANVPREIVAQYEANGAQWPWRVQGTKSGDRLFPPPLKILTCNPDIELHWLWRRFHPDSPEWRDNWRNKGYLMIHFPSRSNKFASEQNLLDMESKGEEFNRRYVRGEWGRPEGVLFDVPHQSIIDPNDDTLSLVKQTWSLHRILDHGYSAPTCCLWAANDRDNNILCVGPDTRVLKADLSWVKASDIKVKDKLIGFDEFHDPKTEKRRWKEADVIDVRFAKKPSYLLKFSDGKQIISSSDHLWLSRYPSKLKTKWIKTEDMVEGKHQVIKVLEPWEFDQSREAGYLAGVYDGEGCYGINNRGTVRLSFAQNPGLVLDHVVKLLTEKEFNFGVHNRRLGGASNVYLNRKRDIFRFLGSIRPKRLVNKFSVSGMKGFKGIESPTLISKEFIGETGVVAISTTTRTFIAEGLASHNCYREYYEVDDQIRRHRERIFALSGGMDKDKKETYRTNLADPSIFQMMPQRAGGRWSVALEWSDQKIYPADTSVWWTRADNNEMASRQRLQEYLWVDPKHKNPFTGELGAPRLYFMQKTKDYPHGCDKTISELKGQRLTKVGTVNNKPIFNDERDETIPDHSFDCLSGDTLVDTPIGSIRIDQLPESGVVCTPLGPLTYTDCMRYSIAKQVVKVQLANGKEVTCTPDHRLMTASGWMRADEVRGQKVLILSASQLLTFVPVIQVTTYGTSDVYCLTVDHPFHGFSVNGGIVVSNCVRYMVMSRPLQPGLLAKKGSIHTFDGYSKLAKDQRRLAEAMGRANK